MRRLCVSLAALSFSMVAAFPAGASGDFSDPPAWRLAHANLTGNADMAMLGPGNDTRVNFTLLLFDRRGITLTPGKGAEPLGALFDWPTFSDWLAPRAGGDESLYSTGEGSRCVTLDSGAAAFEGAIKAAKLASDEAEVLIAARKAFKPDCAKPGGSAAYNGAVKSAAGKAFAAYLSGASSFYDGDFDAAATRFGALRDAETPWVREAARYMAARVEVNRIQVGLFDEYGNMDDDKTANAQGVAAADAGLRAYLKDYPNGAYAASARGLLRRVYWFGGRKNQLAAQYVGMFAARPARAVDDVDLANEVDNKLLRQLKPGDTTDPILLATLDLQLMRTSDGEDDKDCCKDAMSLADLQAQRPAFASNTALFDYLVAAHSFYVGKKPAEVLRLIPDAARQASFTGLQFSRQMLRGMALEAVKDRNALGFWTEMLPGVKVGPQRSALELAIALHHERSGTLPKVFAAGSPVNDARPREILLANVADAALLRQQASGAKVPHERELALYTLLYKELSRGHYRDFLGDVALVPADAADDGALYDFYETEHFPLGVFAKPKSLGDFDCAPLKRTASDLAAKPSDPHAQLCLADFFRSNGFDQYPLDTQPHVDELGGTPTLFAGPVYSRLEVYKQVIANPATAPADKAYALYRAVNCYAPSGNNTCGGTEVGQAQRKAWFNRLKADYPKSRWASDLRYYW